jgi:hypothetical protein
MSHHGITARREPGAHKAALDEFKLAAARLGDTPEKVLQWVLRFVSRDLTALLPGERSNLAWDLRALSVYARNWHFEWKLDEPMPQVDLLELQRELGEGIGAIVRAHETPTLPIGLLPSRWPRSVEQRATLISRAEPQSKGRRYWILWEGQDREAIVAAIWNIIIDVGNKLRACAECRSPFIAIKRQEYCTPACSQRARISRRPRKTGRRRRSLTART